MSEGPYRVPDAPPPERPPFEPLRPLRTAWPWIAASAVFIWDSMWAAATVAMRWLRQRPRRFAWFLLGTSVQKAFTIVPRGAGPPSTGSILDFAIPLVWLLSWFIIFIWPGVAYSVLAQTEGQNAAHIFGGLWVAYRLLIAWARSAMHFDKQEARAKWEAWFLA